LFQSLYTKYVPPSVTLERETGGNLSRRERNLLIADAMLARLTPAQRRVADDPSNLIVLCVPRRGGKTVAEATAQVRTCLKHDGAVCYFGAVTAQRAKDIIWPELKRLEKEFSFECQFKELEKVVVFDNGSIIKLIGCETRKEIEKQRGVPFHRFTLDETASVSPSLVEHLFVSVVFPSLMDYRGTAVMMGSPGIVLTGPFFEAAAPELAKEILARRGEDIAGKVWSRPYEPGAQSDTFCWSSHSWGIPDNTAMPHLWEEALKFKALNNWSDDNPTWRREFLGEWVSDAGARVYHFEEGRNDWEPDFETGAEHGLPAGKDPWHYLLGIDMGYDDPFAVVVAAYSDHDPHLYQVHEYKERGLDTEAMFRVVSRLVDRFGGFTAIIGDHHGSGAKAIFENWQERGIHVEVADKVQKRDFIALVNSELHEGKIKWLANSDLVAEAEGLQWDTDSPRYLKGIYATGRSQPDHLLDAFLYLWRYAYHNLWTGKPQSPVDKSEAYWRGKEDEAFQKACDERKRQDGMEWWEEFDQKPEDDDWSDAAIREHIEEAVW
jgi:hypothetical protein